jgi:hypothetical protein
MAGPLVAVSQIFDRVKSVALRAIMTKRGYWLQVNGGQGGSIANVSSRKFQIWVVLSWHLFPIYNIALYDKNSESDYIFLPPPKSEYFFQQHWESEYFFRKNP